MTHCLVVTCVPCNTPVLKADNHSIIPQEQQPSGDSLFQYEEECNEAFKKEYPEMFDENGVYKIISGDHINQKI
jgi:hypothetical protein